MYGKNNMEIYITICKIDNKWWFSVGLRKLKALYQPRGMGWGGEGDGKEVQKGVDICIPMANSF